MDHRRKWSGFRDLHLIAVSRVFGGVQKNQANELRDSGRSTSNQGLAKRAMPCLFIHGVRQNLFGRGLGLDEELHYSRVRYQLLHHGRVVS